MSSCGPLRFMYLKYTKEAIWCLLTVFPSGFYTESGPISQNLSRKCESLAVLGLTEYGDDIDVVAPTDILKQIFKIPYSKAQLSIAVHRIGDTLILNTGYAVR